MDTTNMRFGNLFLIWLLRGILLALFFILPMDRLISQTPVLDISLFKEVGIVLALSVYFYALWQFDHSIAPIVWRYKDQIYLDGWIIEDFLNWLGKKYFDNPKMGTEFFEITSIYNHCMFWLILIPPIIACLAFL